ncbi:YfbU family protein [Paracidovorax wautersii]|uniref:YfbU domain-containing protein n=1 Tax=Paracidovorax wautersii TaxID=1177982 RepID=A0A1I2E652_9BURK|nr:YfbU family protein [Paracidovorax wautersii]SFE87971.1 hypothetical protein SAMN04489711_106234 [Paracidovorax wautersii]
MPQIELTDAERLILANQYRIRGILEHDDSYAELADDLESGHKWLYQSRLRISPNLSEDDTNLVLDTLALYRLLQSSYEELEDKSEVEKDQVQFPGFDGNNESELLYFCTALCRKARYEELIGRPAKNSHAPTRDNYSRMIGQWRRIGEPSESLTASEIKSILDARR